MTENPWLRVAVPRPAATWRLACVPHAGAGPATFLRWPNLLHPDVEMAAVCLPGRERRIRDPRPDRMGPLVEDLVAALRDWLRPPYALFGHSMGALVAFALAQRLEATGAGPGHLFVSGCVAPPIVRSPMIHVLPDAAFLDEVAVYGGLPPEVLAHQDLVDLVLPVLRDDFAIVETYEPAPEPIAAAITALAGDSDDTVPADGLRAWHRFTTGGLDVERLPGGHLYLAGQEARLTELIGNRLRAPSRMAQNEEALR